MEWSVFSDRGAGQPVFGNPVAADQGVYVAGYPTGASPQTVNSEGEIIVPSIPEVRDILLRLQDDKGELRLKTIWHRAIERETGYKLGAAVAVARIGSLAYICGSSGGPGKSATGTAHVHLYVYAFETDLVPPRQTLPAPDKDTYGASGMNLAAHGDL